MDDTLKSLRDFADTLLEIKKAGGSAADLQAACVAGSVLLLRSRESSRQAALAAEAIKEEASKRRAALDHDSLALHNLVYEQQYYAKEIAACRAFATDVPDEQLGAIGAAEYAAAAGPAAAAAGLHEAELGRLNHELGQRKQLRAHLQSLQQRKQRAAAELGAATGRIDDLRAHMEAVASSSRPLMESSLPEASAVKANREAAELLPLPLYVLYSQAATGAAVVGLPLRVDIDGSTAAAARFAAAAPGGEAAAAAAAAATAPSAKRRRKSDAADDQTYKVHPLSVSLDVFAPGSDCSGEPLAQLSFHYYSQLKLVGVAASSPEDEELLTDLFVGDTGDGQLLENAAVVGAAGDGQAEFAGRPRPFRWAQDLAGVDVLASLPASYTGASRDQALPALSAYRSQLRLEAFVERLAAAKRGRLALKAILDVLAKKEQPSCSWEAKLLTKVNTFISSWRQLSSDVAPIQAGKLESGRPGTGTALAHRGQLQAQQHKQAWQPQGSMQEEEGEVGRGDGDASSLLAHGDTAEEDLLQGLLADDGAGAAPPAAAAAGAEVEEGALPDDEYGELQLYEDEAMLRAPTDGGEPSAGSDDDVRDVRGGGGGSGGDGTSSGQGATALVARHSTYRLVLRSSALEGHFHVRVCAAYPAVPPVFAVTKLLDTTRSKAAAPIEAVNEVLMLEQQANAAAVEAAVRTDACEVLALQVLQLRQCLDLLSSQLRTDTSSKDLVDKLKAKQQLRGRERQPRLMACEQL